MVYYFTSDVLSDLGATDDEDFDILEAALALASLDHPGVVLESYRAHLDQLVEDCGTLGATARDADTQAAVLSSIIAIRYGYTGDSQTYDDAANANLIEVIDRRLGLPVALGIIYIGVARRLGWEICGLNVPAHFLVSVGRDMQAVVVDPFDDGRLLDPDKLPERLTGLGVSSDQLDLVSLPVLPDRAVLVRLLNNLSTRAELSGDLPRALELHQRMTSLAPCYTGLWWERARLEQVLGQLSAARASLTNMLETTRDAELEKRIRLAQVVLARSLN